MVDSTRMNTGVRGPWHAFAWIAAIGFTTAMAGCGPEEAGIAPEQDEGAAEAHMHPAPHGGELIALGDHEANLEVVFEPESGTMTVYLLGPHAESSVRSQAEALPATVVPEGGQPIDVELKAVASALTGETVGDTSQFEAKVAELLEARSFTLRIERLMVGGMSYESVEALIEAPHAH